MKIDLTPRQVEELRGSIHRTLLDMMAECFEEETYEHETLSDYCREIRRGSQILERILEKLNKGA